MRPSSSSSARPRSGSGPPSNLSQLGKLALAGRLGRPQRFAARERGGAGVDLEIQLGREPGRPQQPQRVGGEAIRSNDAQHSALEVGEAAVRVDRLASGERHGDRADREVAGGEVGARSSRRAGR